MIKWTERLEDGLFLKSRNMAAPWGPLLRLLRFPAALVRDWLKGEINVRAMSLAYTTLLSLVPQIVQSIFNGGSVRANIRLTQAQRQEAVLRYAQSIVQGVDDVDTAINDFRQYGKQVTTQASLAASATDSARLADVRFRGGVTTYLEVLDSDTRSFDAQLQLTRTQLAEVTSLISLYQALGGGWQPEPE